MKIVFMGTPDFAVPCLRALLDAGHTVVGVFTQPDKPRGRGYKLAPPPVKALAAEREIPVWQPQTLRDGQALSVLRELAPDLIVVVAYGRILPKEVLELPPFGCINVHGSLLPKYRGAAPIQWSVINGDTDAGVTTMYMAEGLDCGDMILTARTPVGEAETSGELYGRLAGLGARLLCETVERIAAGDAPRIPQDGAQATQAPMLEKQMACIDFSRPARAVHKLICGMNPWPVAHTMLGGKTLKVYRSCPVSGNGKPGEVLEGKKRLVVACGEGAVEFTEIQAEGGKRMPASAYLQGHPAEPGTILGGG